MEPIRVLLVDDNATFLRNAVRFVEEHEELVVVGTACNGGEVLDQAPHLQPEVILLDLHMPGMGGLEAIPRLRAVLPEAGIIAMTLYGEDMYRKAALAAGADEFLDKAALVIELLPAIRRVVKR